jgi:DNA-binding MarR family transcriptional regulator
MSQTPNIDTTDTTEAPDTLDTTVDDLDGFDQVIHAPVRLRICAALASVREIEFSTLLTVLGISKSALSKHITVLADADYVAQRRAVRDTRQRLWLTLTPTGRTAYEGHVAALRHIVGDNSQA